MINKSLAEILIINTGSSSIKIALYEMNDEPVLKLSGKIESIGSKNSTLVVNESDKKIKFPIDVSNFHSAVFTA